MTFKEHQAKAGKSGKGEAKRRSAEHYAAMVAARKAKQSAKQPVEEKKSESQAQCDATVCVSGNANV